MGQRDNFSNSDIQKINRMYKCRKSTSSTGYKLDLLTILNSVFGNGQ